MNKYIYKNIFIYKLYRHNSINQNIIEQHKFSKLKTLICNDNINIKSVNHLAGTLEIFDCNMMCTGYNDVDRGIGQDGIAQLKKIKILNCSNNYNIKDVNHMSETLASLSG